MPTTTAEAAHLAIEVHRAEIRRLQAQTPQDQLAIEQHFSECQRLCRLIASAEHLVAAAETSRYQRERPEITAFFERYFPHATTILTPGAFRATR